jgi:ABC-2 type transport system permease protein
LGKLGVIGFLVASVAIGPAIVAYVLGAVFSLDLSVVPDTVRLLVASTILGTVIVVSAGMLILAMSSLSRRSLYVGIAWLGLWLIGSTVASALDGVARGMLYRQLIDAEMAKANQELPADADQNQRQNQREVQQRAHSQALLHYQEALAEYTRRNWRPLFSYTANLERLGESLLGTDAAWVQLGGAVSGPMSRGPRMAPGPRPRGPDTNNRALADQMVMQYPWWWSAAVLASLLGISVCTLSGRVKSLDRLR